MAGMTSSPSLPTAAAAARGLEGGGVALGGVAVGVDGGPVMEAGAMSVVGGGPLPDVPEGSECAVGAEGSKGGTGDGAGAAQGMKVRLGSSK